jgi:TldD protein
MKPTMLRHFLRIAVMTMVIVTAMAFRAAVADETSRPVLLRAIHDELDRNMEKLVIEDMAAPFFISYGIHDVRSVIVSAALGAVVRSSEDHHRSRSVRVLVGDYAMNDENFRGGGYSFSSSMIGGSDALPLGDDYDAVRRALWISTDATYKAAAELFEHKKAALAQQTLFDDEVRIDDFSREQAVTYTEPPRPVLVDKAAWEETCRRLSAMFSDYPGIASAQVRFFSFAADLLFVSSEGTEVAQPLTVAGVQVNAFTQADDGEPMTDHLSWYGVTPADLPDEAVMIDAVREMADRIDALRTAAVFDDSYFGPVLFVDQAAVELFSQRLFAGRNGLMAFRRPVVSNTGGGYRVSDDETLEDRIERRILASDISITARPRLDEWDGVRLIGSYGVDAEGVRPPMTLPLVEDGMLVTLLNNRTPTPRLPGSSGHQRMFVSNGLYTGETLGPGVIEVTTNTPRTVESLTAELLERAADEGMDYGIIVERLKPLTTGADLGDPSARLTMNYGGRADGNLSEPLAIYKVYVADGSREPVRSVRLGAVTVSTLRHILGASGESMLANTLATAAYHPGIPASFIVPRAVLVEELEVTEEKRDFTPRPPVVMSPLAGN